MKCHKCPNYGYLKYAANSVKNSSDNDCPIGSFFDSQGGSAGSHPAGTAVGKDPLTCRDAGQGSSAHGAETVWGVTLRQQPVGRSRSADETLRLAAPARAGERRCGIPSTVGVLVRWDQAAVSASSISVNSAAQGSTGISWGASARMRVRSQSAMGTGSGCRV
jgi:hypothetical protein